MALWNTTDSCIRPRAVRHRWRRPPARGLRDLRPRLENLEERSLLSFAITDLGTLGGAYSEAIGLNNDGQVVGESWTDAVDQYGQPVYHAFLWDSTHGMRDLGTLNSDLNSAAAGINDAGQIVGASSTAPVLKVNKKTGDSYYVSTVHAVSWSSDLKLQKLGDGAALGINASGEIVGGSNNNAVLWDGGRATNLGTLGGTGNPSGASSINGAGQVVGVSTINDRYQTQHAFLWTPTTPDGTKGTMKDLGALDPSPGYSSFATAVNALGEVAGFSNVNNGVGTPDAFLYTGGTMYDLGTLGGVYTESVATSINSSGDVLGYSQDSLGLTRHAVLWIPTSPNAASGQMTDLNSLIPTGSGWVLNYTGAMNDAGLIVGTGTINGQEHAFLLTPVTTTAVARPAAVAASATAALTAAQPQPGDGTPAATSPRPSISGGGLLLASSPSGGNRFGLAAVPGSVWTTPQPAGATRPAAPSAPVSLLGPFITIYLSPDGQAVDSLKRTRIM